ncbi:MAG: AraC family transcriptional regulator [Prevotella sp.]|nr:AraC family transcriptional regulator [Prevotella sp.]
MTKKAFLLAGIILTVTLTMMAQTPVEVTEAAKQQLNAFTEHPDTKTANLFFAQLDKEEFTEEKIQFGASTPPTDTLRAQVWYWASEYYYAAGGYQEAKEYALRALPLLKKGKDETTLADCLNILAISHVRMGKYPEAIDYAKQVYELDERSGDAERISMSLNTLAGLYLSARQPQEAEQYVVRGLRLAEQSGLEYRQAIVEGMAAEVYHALGRDTLAVRYAEHAYQREVKLQRPHKAMIRLSQKAAALIGLKRYAEAKSAADEAIRFFRQQGGQPQSLAITLNERGEAALGLGQTTEAKADFREAATLFVQMGDHRNEMHARKGLYECLYKTQPDSARIEMERFVTLRDSVYNLASAESLARYNAEFGNDFLRDENAAERSARQRILIAVCILLLVLALAIAATAYYERRYRRKQQERISLLLAQIEEERNVIATSAGAEQPAQASAADEFVEKANAVIRQLMKEGQTDTKRVAAEMCLSPAQFRRKIQAATGLTAANYILAVRMDEAKRLLAEYPKHTVSEIAQKCGFADNAHFGHAFKRVFNTTPLEYARGKK